jgi:nucleotide-binding universal stress UspA family protein
MKTILVPTDFSNYAQWALRMAATLARQAKCSILLLHVVEHPINDSFNVEGQVSTDAGWEDKLYMLKLIERAKKELAQATAELASQGIASKTILRMGNPFHAINHEVLAQEADLVVMGVAGESIVKDLTHGSNTDKVIRLVKCPVLTVSEDPGNKTFGDIVYATSLAEEERNFGYVVKNIQQLFNSTIHLVRINTPMIFKPDREVLPVMEKFAEDLNLGNFIIHTPSDIDAETGIVHFASKVNASLICMTTHGYRGLKLLFMGSIAENVIRHTGKPVLTWVMQEEPVLQK